MRHLDLMRSITIRNLDGVDLLVRRKTCCRGELGYHLRHDASGSPVIKRKLRREDRNGGLFKSLSIAARIVLPFGGNRYNLSLLYGRVLRLLAQFLDVTGIRLGALL